MQRGSLFLLVGILALWAALQPASGQVPLEKPGRCPPDYIRCIQAEPNECLHDRQCRGRLKCCYNACAYRCVEPVPGQA
ncbi:porwaprin-b-like [Alligator sinensis]|uniref:Porwaprin-b-like n=1 Tax=Alligator sinensis TaxID=38654 RepID=A0A1U8DZQ8_ALLSI|nr:porwaprin-b-like [Alligator sinensis]